MEGGSGNMLSTQNELLLLLDTYNLPIRPINIDEYSTSPEQVPSASAWWIAQLERVDAHGLRGNWLSGWELHDFLASLLSKPNAANITAYNETGGGYWPNGDYQVYKYYNLEMTGDRVGTTPSADLAFDTYATVSRSGQVKILAGSRAEVGTWEILVKGVRGQGVEVSVVSFPFTGGHFGEVNSWVNERTVWYEVVEGQVTIPVVFNDTSTAFAFEFLAS